MQQLIEKKPATVLRLLGGISTRRRPYTAEKKQDRERQTKKSIPKEGPARPIQNETKELNPPYDAFGKEKRRNSPGNRHVGGIS